MTRAGRNVDLLCVVSILPAGMFKLCVPSAHGGQKRVRDPLELESQLSGTTGVLGTEPGSSAGPIPPPNSIAVLVLEVKFPEPRASP